MIEGLNIIEEPDLHLTVSMRTVRTDCLNRFVESLLSLEVTSASDSYNKLGRKFPLVITRDLEKAKQWVETISVDSDRYGRLMSSQTKKILDSANGIQTSSWERFDAPSWFLNDKGDPKSSFNLDTYASEFDVQGLELDYAIVEWGSDFRYVSDTWHFYKKWYSDWKELGAMTDGIEALPLNQNYILNTYRVLLTRCRKGMVIYIPKKIAGSSLPVDNDGIYRLLKSIGIDEI